MSYEEMYDKVSAYLSTGYVANWDKIFDEIEKYSQEERSHGYSKGFDDGYAQAEVDRSFDDMDHLH